VSELVTVEFENDKYRASDVLHELRLRDCDWVVDLEDAVAAYRNYDGILHVEYSDGVTAGAGAAWGALLGSFIGAIVATPFMAGAAVGAAVAVLAAGALAGAALGAAAGAIDAAWSREDACVDSAFVRDVGASLQPGDSAIFVPIDASYPAVVAEQFKRYGGTVRRSSLTPAQAAALGDYLRDRSAA
jgi:uncharacterized membrane protein